MCHLLRKWGMMRFKVGKAERCGNTLSCDLVAFGVDLGLLTRQLEDAER